MQSYCGTGAVGYLCRTKSGVLQQKKRAFQQPLCAVRNGMGF
jgi:hypothetical protein